MLGCLLDGMFVRERAKGARDVHTDTASRTTTKITKMQEKDRICLVANMRARITRLVCEFHECECR